MSSEMEISKFLERIQTPTKKLGVEELRQREEIWRALWSWIDEEVKYYAIRAGAMFRIMKRDYKGALGELGAVKFEVKEYELIVYEKTYNYNDGKYYFEHKICKIPHGTVMMVEHVTEQELVDDDKKLEVGSFEEEGVLT